MGYRHNPLFFANSYALQPPHIAGLPGVNAAMESVAGKNVCKIIGWSLHRAKAHRSLPYRYTAHSKDIVIILLFWQRGVPQVA